MILETALLGTSLATAFMQAWKALDIDEKTLATLEKAHTKHADAVHLFQSHKQAADQSIQKLVNRKKAMLSTRMTAFIATYQNIRAINFLPGEGILELDSTALSVRQADEIKEMAVTSLKPMTEQELAVRYIFTGIGGLMLADSKQKEKMANSQLQIAKIHFNQMETMVIAVDAIGERAEQVASLLSRFSVLFERSIRATDEIIRRNGADRSLYSRADRDVLMNCVNLAGAIKTVLDVPILGKDGSVTEASLNALNEGEKRLQDIRMKTGG